MMSGAAASEDLPRGEGDQVLHARADENKRAQDSARIAPTIGGLASRSARLSRASNLRSRVHSRPARNYPPAPVLLAAASSRGVPPAPSGSAVRLQSVLDRADCGCVAHPKSAAPRPNVQYGSAGRAI